MNADIRIYPGKEMKAADMAVALDSLSFADGIIQGCDISISNGALVITDGRIMIRGRLGVITGGSIETPILVSSGTCRLLAVCDLAIDPPFYVSLFTNDDYTDLVERVEYVSDFNATNGVAFVEFGRAEIDATTGSVTSWTKNESSSVYRAVVPYVNKFGGNYLSSGININNLSKKDSGWWAYARSDVSGTFPLSDTYGTIGHIQGTSENFATQILRSNNQTNSSTIMYVRYKANGVWGDWQRYVSSSKKTLTIDRVGNSYCNATDISYLSAGVKNGFLYLRGNLHLSVNLPRESENVTIARINGWHGAYNAIICAPAQSGFASLIVQVSDTGVIKISNYSTQPDPTWTFAGWYRFNLIVPVADGYE